jgi:hypothetical protein
MRGQVLPEIKELERLIQVADSLDRERTRLIREKFLGVASLIGDVGKARKLISDFMVAHHNLEAAIARGGPVNSIESSRQNCLAALAQFELAIEAPARN